MAETRKPNTICRNPNCTHGSDGGRKHFYACLTCLRHETWRSYCCCFDCYVEYTQIVLNMREKAKANNEVIQPQYPERTDMTVDKIKEIMQKDTQDVVEYTKNVELKDYFDENPGMPLSDIIEQVNEDIDANTPHIKKRRKNRL